MRFLIVNTDYPEFLADLYGRNPALAEGSYEEQLKARHDSLFSMADFYSKNLRTLGHEAWETYPNNEPLQRAWAKEHGLRMPSRVRRRVVMRRGLVPWVRSEPDSRWAEITLAAQIEHYRPDVLINHNLFTVAEDVIRLAKPRLGLVAAQHAATAPPKGRDWRLYDVFLSSFQSTLDFFRQRGLRAEYLPLGFEPSVWDRVAGATRDIPVSFVGSLHGVHSSRREWLECLARHIDLRVWTPAPQAVPDGSPLRQCLQGTAWGLGMYRVLAASRITLNHHGDVGPYANNLRLFEATGVGAALITDAKTNLGEYFDVGKEVVAYRTTEECIELIRYLLANEADRQDIASSGQRRTLSEHTWLRRMERLVQIVEACL